MRTLSFILALASAAAGQTQNPPPEAVGTVFRADARLVNRLLRERLSG